MMKDLEKLEIRLSILDGERQADRNIERFLIKVFSNNEFRDIKLEEK